MADWENVKTGLGKAKDTVVEKTDALTNIASTYIKIKENRSKVKHEIEDLGEYVLNNYENLETDEQKENFNNEVMSAIASINGLKEIGEQLKEKLKELKSKK